MRRQTILFAVLATLVVTPRIAAAEDEAASVRESAPPKSAGLALGLSIGLPVAGYGMMALTGLVPGDVTTFRKLVMVTGATLAFAGPSGGNLYTGRVGRALAFTGGRLLLATIGLFAITEAIQNGDSSEFDYHPGTARAYMMGTYLCAAGILGLSVWESVDTYRVARRAERVEAERVTVAIAPMVVEDGRRLSLTGLSFGGTF